MHLAFNTYMNYEFRNLLCSDDGSSWSHEAAAPRGHAPLVLTSVPGLRQPARSQWLDRHHQIQLRREIDRLDKLVAERESKVEQNRFDVLLEMAGLENY